MRETRDKAELRQMLDGSWRVYYQDRLIATHEATETAEPIPAKRRRKGSRAAADSAWIYMQSAPNSNPPAKSVRRAGPGGVIGATRIA